MSPDKTPWVVVTGAAGSLGSALARHCADKGRRLLALDQSPAPPEALGAAIDIVYRSVDLADATAVENILGECVPRHEPIALLLNTAGLIWNEPVLAVRGGRFTGHDPASWDRVLRANLTTAFAAGTRVAARMARTGGGLIVNFSSISARGNAGQVAYAAAKAGIEGLTRAMAQELGPLGIRVNAIAPGFIDVASTRAALTDPVIAAYVDRTPLRRLGTTADIADAVDALERNIFVTGSVLELDGGLRL
jgi:3-oxoacyl-[acyl-carrier protein] reductase